MYFVAGWIKLVSSNFVYKYLNTNFTSLICQVVLNMVKVNVNSAVYFI